LCVDAKVDANGVHKLTKKIIFTVMKVN
jgi:hypothetical protein